MRVIDPKTEREVTCTRCGERLGYFATDVTVTEMPDGPATVTRGGGGCSVTVVGMWKHVRIVTCIACGATVEVGDGT